jgi:hypothetical protein
MAHAPDRTASYDPRFGTFSWPPARTGNASPHAESTQISEAVPVAHSGLVPLTAALGVTGHRNLDDGPGLRERIGDAIGRVPGVLGFQPGHATPITFAVVSALAEGADRIVTHEVLALEGASLDAVLPLPVEDYARDFETPESMAEFRTLLDRAVQVTVVERAASRDDAYEWAGREVVDRSDVLLALWDGEPARGKGGTAEVVDYARTAGVPVIWIPTTGAPILEYPPSTDAAPVTGDRARLGRSAVLELERYNRLSVGDSALTHHVEVNATYLAPPDEVAAALNEDLKRAEAWVLPAFARADLLALRYQKRHAHLGLLMFALAAAAVAVVALQSRLAPEQHQWAWLEVTALLGVFLAYTVGRTFRPHNRWVSYRFLAERLRSAYFLSLVIQSGDGSGRVRSDVLVTDASEEWLTRAFAELWRLRPAGGARDDQVPALRRYLADAWVRGQLAYHDKTRARHERHHRTLGWLMAGLFTVSFVAAVLHAAGIGHGATWEDTLVLFSIIVPAAGAAASGVAEQRDYRRHAERDGRMVVRLRGQVATVEAARTLADLRAAALETEALMLQENSDWFGSVRLTGFEQLHV